MTEKQATKVLRGGIEKREKEGEENEAKQSLTNTSCG